MRFLKPVRDHDAGCWNSGSAPAPNISESDEGDRIYITCRFGSLGELHTAMVDTGGIWTLISEELAEELRERGDLGHFMESRLIQSGSFQMNVNLHRVKVTLLSEEGFGENLEVDATVAVSREWTRQPKIGFRGMIERVRLAYEPGVEIDQESRIYFGAP